MNISGSYLYTEITKPFFDILAALILLTLTFPLFATIAVILLTTNDHKVFFFQARPGKGERIFTLIKFKTMNDLTDTKGNTLPDPERLTRMGKFLRALSLDELPQLINVIKGEMSFVGPRPLLVQYLPLYTDYQRRRHLVKPGITGWAQVNGRNAISWPQRFHLDVWYVDNISFWLDIKILFITILKVVKAEGIGSKTSPTMENFKGNSSE